MKPINEKLKDHDKTGKVFVVTDENLAKLYLQDLLASLADFETSYYISPSGEEAKTPKTYLDLVQAMAKTKVTRSDTVLALGGGAIGDLAGFAAATYLRGLDIVQVPTSLLAAVDSSIGGKVAINLPQGKNLLGAFHMPLFVHTDPAYFKSLSPDQVRDGMGEVIKYGIIKDPELFSRLEDKSYIENNMADLVQTCQEIKKDIVSRDPYDTGLRQILNFGHTLGHCLEHLSDYSLGHGSAVAAGIQLISAYSARSGLASWDDYQRIVDLFKAYGFETKMDRLYNRYIGLDKSLLKDRMIDIIKSDKKRQGDKINIIVLRRIGKVESIKIDIERIGQIIWIP